MTSYRYVAVDAGGGRHQGELQAEHPRAARARLREQGLLAETLSPRDLGAAAPGLLRRRLSSLDLALFSRQFATLLAAGLNLDKALSALAEQPEHGTMRALLGSLREDVLAGHSLASALERQPRDIPRHYAAIVRAGEESGTLPTVMAHLADYLERGQALRRKVLMALLYPAIVCFVAALVIGLLLTYVVPQVVAVFELSRQSLPWLTQAMISLSDLLRAGWWLGPIVLVVALVAAPRLLAVPVLRRRWHAFLLRLPVFGPLRRGLAAARFANSLAALVGSGVPVVTALGHAGAAQEDQVFREGVAIATERVREGMEVSRALREAGPFPPLLLHLVASGEASGELPTVLAQAARQQELLVETRITALTAILEPLLILAMGVVVLVIVLATLEPLIEMNRLLH